MTHTSVRAPAPVMFASVPRAAWLSCRIDGDAERRQGTADLLPHRRGVLADATREDHRVGPAQHGHKSADVFLYAVAEHVDSQLRAPVAPPALLQERAHVVSQAGKAQQPALLVQQRACFGDAQAGLLHQVEHRAGIHIARPGAHRQPFERA